MLSLSILIPLIGALALAAMPAMPEATARRIAIGVAAIPLALLLIVWAGFRPGAGFQWVEEMPWMPGLGIAWRLGVDGLSLSLTLMSALLFLAAIAWPMAPLPRARSYYAWFLFLMSVSLGLFLALDLVIFYVFFDLGLVGMYFLIGRWGHGEAERAALKFFIYTLAGSLLILIGIIVLALSMPVLSFDMRAVIAAAPLDGTGLTAVLVLLAFVIGFGIKTPLFPFHTWLPPAHVNAPGPVSAILAGVLLKMGTYGLIRLAMQMMPATFADWAMPIAVVAVISILWGAIVALGQSDLKRRIAYTSVNHMGYTVLGIAVAGSALGSEAARAMALTGAVVEMIAHGLITGALFLIAGAFWQRAEEYEMDSYGGLARLAPRLTGATVLASFASLGLPGLAGFVAELHIFLGAFAVYPWLAAVGLIGLLITAALFLDILRRVFFGDLPKARESFTDLTQTEIGILAGLLALVVLIGVWPGWLLGLIGAASLLPMAG
ncbi:complex I subunit 4 family protein [Paracoccus jeotgali]|uniref:Oxidoreductase n=1 Tax=Paracoccus jeotgali TaxID=2065379 RepID=A0A2K9MDU1_9RHOB|nr:NADH-quinone oxidoreductase subunit M [Paracoccus jeotgali]AUM73818.1 oxidoreductase [Paracoccus jeotgali]